LPLVGLATRPLHLHSANAARDRGQQARYRMDSFAHEALLPCGRCASIPTIAQKETLGDDFDAQFAAFGIALHQAGHPAAPHFERLRSTERN